MALVNATHQSQGSSKVKAFTSKNNLSAYTHLVFQAEKAFTDHQEVWRKVVIVMGRGPVSSDIWLMLSELPCLSRGCPSFR